MTNQHQGARGEQVPTADLPQQDALTPTAVAGSDSRQAAATLAGRFQLLGEIACGGMGVVYSALDPQFGREVAVKVLHDRLSDWSDAARRFAEESRITGQLQHPGIPAVFESGLLDDGRPFLAMKLVKGRTLADLLEGGGPNRADLVPAFEQVCQAVAYAHSRRVIHRDLKPANVMVGAFGEVQVMDWGLAKVLGERAESEPADPEATTAGGTKIHDPRSDSGGSETQAGDVLGTVAYMPPEQASGALGLIDERADVFGLGAVLCVILTGKPPYVARDAEAARLMAVRGKLEECHARLGASGADPELVALARRCLSPEVVDRPRNAGEVAIAVAELRRNAEERARQAELDRAGAELRSVEERKRRRVQLALAASVVGFLLLGGTGGWWAQPQSAERRLEALAREEQERRVREGVESALARLPDFYERALWKQANATLTQAEGLLGDGGDPELDARVEEARRDTEFVRRLDEIRMGKVEIGVGGNYDTVGALPKYAAAFRDNGFDADNADGIALKAWLSRSRVRAYALAALDDWATTGKDPVWRNRLFALTDEATGQRWRTRLAEAWDDGPRLEKVYDAIRPDQRSSAVIAAVGKRLDALGRDGVRRLEEGLRRYPTDFWLHESLGPIGGVAQAERRAGAHRAALAIRPGTVGVLLNLGTALRDKKDLDGAIASYRETIRLAPSYVKAHSNLGLALGDKKDFDGAIASFREAIRLDPKDAMAHTSLGIALHYKKDLDGAIASHREAIRLDPRQSQAHINLGNALLDKKDPDGAIASYREAIRLSPKLAGAHSNLGNALRDKKDPDGAIASYREAIRLDPTFAPAHNGLGSVLGDKNTNLDGAIVCFREAVRLDPTFGQAFDNLGRALSGKLDFDGAIAAHREALRIDPKNAPAHSNLGAALFDKKDLDGAAASYREAIRLDPQLAEAHHNLGVVYYLQGRYPESLRALGKVRSLTPKDEATLRLIGSAESLHSLDRRLADVKRGADKPRSPAEAVAFARLSGQAFKKEYALAYRLLLSAFEDDAKLAVPNNRYFAACKAVRYAAGDDISEKPSGKQRASLRKQAAEWVAVDLASVRKLAASEKPENRQRAARAFRYWLEDDDLVTVRDPKRLEALPPEERQRWEAFWADVRAELAKATATAAGGR